MASCFIVLTPVNLYGLNTALAAQRLGNSWTKAHYSISANIVSSGAAKKISPFVNFKVFMLFSRNNPHSSHEEGD